MNKVLEMKFGAHLYGTETPDSDLDLKGLYIPDARQIVLGQYAKTIQVKRPKEACERNTRDDVDVEIFSLDRFLELLMEGQTVALDMLFAPRKFWTNQTSLDGHILMNFIYDNRSELLTRNVNAFVGYARQQAAKYGIKGSRMDVLKRALAVLAPLREWDRLTAHTEKVDALIKECSALVSLEKTALVEMIQIPGVDKITPLPHLQVCGRKIPMTATVKFATDCLGRILEGYGNRAKKAHLAGGVDWKALSHAVRVNGQAMELLKTNHITFPRPDARPLVQIKTGQMPYPAVAEMIEQGLADLYVAHAESKLRDTPNKDFAADTIFKCYTNVVKNGVIV